MINSVDSNKCAFCNNLPETLQHLFYDYNKVREHWRNLEKWILTKTGIRISFTKNKIIFGVIVDKMSKHINWLILNVKYYVFSTKIVKINVCINTIKVVLGKKFQIEKYIYYKN